MSIVDKETLGMSVVDKEAFVALYAPPNTTTFSVAERAGRALRFSRPTASHERTLDRVALGVRLPVEALTSTVGGLQREDPLDPLAVRIVADAVAAFGCS
jgi:hypothetical protein